MSDPAAALIPFLRSDLTGPFAAAAETARAFAAQARADNTKRAYRADWADFKGWCAERSLDALPAAAETVTLYVASRAAGTNGLAGLRVSTLERRLAAISQAHRLASYASPASTREEPLHSVWAGLVRQRGRRPVRVAPALTEDVRAFVRMITITDLLALSPDIRLRGLRDRALLLVGFAGALRRSELAALRVEDLAVGPDGLRLRISRSKGDQEGEGAVLGLKHGADVQTCPVRSVQAWLNASGIREGPVFRAVGRAGAVAARGIDARTVARVVKARARQAGLDPALYAGHSLRAGFATQAARAGVPERVIMRHTRHKDVKTLRAYIREGALFGDENPTSSLGL